MEPQTVTPRDKCCLFIDTKEKNVVEAFAYVCKHDNISLGNSVFADSLRIGDYVIATKRDNEGDDSDGNLQVRMVFERKTHQDLVDSIGSTRWTNQISKLLRYREEYPDTIVGYIIEGDPHPESSFYSHAAEALVDVGFVVHHTASTPQTVRYLLRRVKTVGESTSLPDLVSRKIAAYKEFQGKKYDISPPTFLTELLKIIPKITPQCAEVIASRYTSVFDFLTNCTPEDLVGTMYTTAKGKQAKIGRKRAQDIIAMLWNTDLGERIAVQRLVQKRSEKKRSEADGPISSSKSKRVKRDS